MVKLKKDIFEKKAAGTCYRHDNNIELNDENAKETIRDDNTSNTPRENIECLAKDGGEDMVELFIADSESPSASATFSSCALRTSDVEDRRQCVNSTDNTTCDLSIKTNHLYDALENNDVDEDEDDEHFMIIDDSETPTLAAKLIPKTTSHCKDYNEEIVKIPNLGNLKQLHTYVAINTIDEGATKNGLDNEVEKISKQTADEDEDDDEEDDEEVGRRLMNNNQYGLVRKHGGDGNSPPHRSRTPSVDSTGEHCRVCHCRGDEALIAPCSCNGSLKYVHETCLITWMKNPFKDSCEICKQKILIVKKRKPIYTVSKKFIKFFANVGQGSPVSRTRFLSLFLLVYKRNVLYVISFSACATMG